MNDERFFEEFIEIYKEEKDKFLSYNINVIDELHANENANSRILARLFKYKKNNCFEILDSFLNTFFKNPHDLIVDLKQPEITVEKERIDICIIGKSYAIIIENKFNDAFDRPNQLARYIEVVINKKIKEENIFVVYMPGDKHKEPSYNSWESEKEKDEKGSIVNYRESFKNRYLKLPFPTHIIQWLENDVLPITRVTEDLLYSALIQYIDFLKGNFGLRKNKMTMKLEDKIKKHFNGDVEAIRELIIRSLECEKKIHEDERNSWKERINKDFNEYYSKVNGSEFEDGNYTIGFPFLYEGNVFLIYIKCYNYKIFACKLISKEETIPIPNDLLERLKPIEGIDYSEEKVGEDVFTIRINTSINKAYDTFKGLFETIKNEVSPIDSNIKITKEDFI